MPIQDLSQNEIPAPLVGKMLGFTALPAPPEFLGLDMYEFLIQPIRQKDKDEGALFVKRLFTGPQALWEQTQKQIFALKDIYSVTKCPDALLPFLKNIVGWTEDLRSITDTLTSIQLRRLISISTALWKTRGPEDAITNVIRFLTGAQSRVWNWFDYRWVVDETVLSEEHDGRDANMIDAPGGPAADEYVIHVRVADDGELNRDVVRAILRLVRPMNERIEVAFIRFLDLFDTDGDTSQWDVSEGANFRVESGNLVLDDLATQAALTNVDGSDDWTDFTSYWRLRGTGVFGAMFCAADFENGYRVSLDVALQVIRLSKVILGAETILATIPYVLLEDVYYGVRVEVVDESGPSRIKVYVDAELKIETTDSSFDSGALGAFALSAGTVEVDEVEMALLPFDVETVGVNE
jgi:phage tail-like protein